MPSEEIFLDSLEHEDFYDPDFSTKEGGSGIGLTTARELAGLGAKVAICGRKAEKIEAGRAALAADGFGEDRVLGGTCDIRDPDQVAAFVGQVLERFGKIDVLVNNAATNPTSGPCSTSRSPPGTRRSR